jgi:hypothetical protein
MTAYGPEDGEMVLFCGHMREVTEDFLHLPAGCHWYRTDGEVVSPAGEQLDAKWVCVCEACHIAHRSNIGRAVRMHGRWIGPPPPIDLVN